MGGQAFQSLSEELQRHFLDTELPVEEITSEDVDEVRDLFVRLQAGLPLNPQEKRDAQPGNFNLYILNLGGKAELDIPGHPFFRQLVVPNQNRGGTRTLAAQIAMLFLSRRAVSPETFGNIASKDVDDFYHTHIAFDHESKECKRLYEILDKLDSLLSNGKRPKIRSHIAIHLVLLLDDLWDDYTRSWESRLASAVDGFIAALATATKKAKSDPDEPNELWNRYGQWARTGADSGASIARRHRYFSEWLYEHLQPLQVKDPARVFGMLDKTIIYFRDEKKCQRCEADVQWSEAEFHHVEEYHKGGATQLSNGALVHKHCHPKGKSEVKEFAEKWRQRFSSLSPAHQ